MRRNSRRSAGASAREHRDRLDVRGVREHVDDARRGQRVPVVVDQHRGVARERRRVARHVDDPLAADRRRAAP